MAAKRRKPRGSKTTRKKKSPSRKPARSKAKKLPKMKPPAARKRARKVTVAAEKAAPGGIIAAPPRHKKTRRLTAGEMRVYRELLARRAQIVEEIMQKLSLELHDESLIDEADLANRDTASEFLMSLATIEGEELKNIDDAIRAIHEGNYGKCILCGGQIPADRLKAMPSAKLCLKCKQLEEENGKP